MTSNSPTRRSTARFSAVRKLAAAAVLTGTLVTMGAGAASAGPLDDLDLLPEGTHKPAVTKPLKPTIPPLQPTERPANTDARPFLRYGYCAYNGFTVDFHDPDGSDLRMTVEIGFRRGWGPHQVWTMSYEKPVDAWFAELPSDANNIVVQATDEDGNFSYATHMDPQPRNGCNVTENAFNNDQNTDIFEVLGVR